MLKPLHYRAFVTMAAQDDNTNADVDPPKQQVLFSLNIFETLDKSQNTHGVMHEDYHQYQVYCTNRLRRLRHDKAVRRDLVHNSKYAEGVQMRRNAYCPRNGKAKKQQQQQPKGDSEKSETEETNEEEEEETVEPTIIEHENFLWVPLYQAERAWAQACDVQKQKRANKTKQLVLRKLRKAMKFVATLQEMSTRACDEATQEEIASYAGWMKGNYALQKAEYRSALESYGTAMTLLLKLAHHQQEKGQDDPQSLVLADLWTTRAESVLRPLVRFCQYECKDTSPDLAFAETTTSSSSKATDSEIVIHFRDKDIPLDAYKLLCVLYLKAEALQQQLREGTGNEASFISLLSLYDDGIAFIESELAQYQNIQAGPAVNAKKEELAYLDGYFQYQKLHMSLHKNEERLAGCTSDDERVHVYDALLQNAEAMAQIGAGSGPEEEEAQAHVLRIRAFRCYCLSNVYLDRLQMPREALALWKQTKTLTKRAIEELGACDARDKQHEEELENYLEELEKMQDNELIGLEVRCKASCYLRDIGAPRGFDEGTDRPLWMRLDECDPGVDGAPLIEPMPMPIPIPPKPAFYDIAGRYALGCFPMEELDEHIERLKPKKSSGGIFGWFKKE